MTLVRHLAPSVHLNGNLYREPRIWKCGVAEILEYRIKWRFGQSRAKIRIGLGIGLGTVFVCFYLVVDGVIFWQQKIKQRRYAVRAIASIPSTTEHSPGKPELDGSKPRPHELGY